MFDHNRLPFDITRPEKTEIFHNFSSVSTFSDNSHSQNYRCLVVPKIFVALIC